MTGSSNGNGNGSARVGTDRVKQGLAQMLKGGVIVSSVLLLMLCVYLLSIYHLSDVSCWMGPFMVFLFGAMWCICSAF